MAYTREMLEKTKIQALRDLYREEFGGTPGELLKGPLIDKILDAQQGGAVPERSKRGRPSYGALSSSKSGYVELPYANDTFAPFEVRTSAPKDYEETLPENYYEAYGNGANGKVVGKTEEVNGTLEITDGGFGFLRGKNLKVDASTDVFVSKSEIAEYSLRNGDYIDGIAVRNNDGLLALKLVRKLNGATFEKVGARTYFDELVPCYPSEKIALYHGNDDIALKIIDTLFPIGKGQRCLISAPQSFGKTTLIKNIAKSVASNNGKINLSVLLLGERPEEITDFKTQTDAEIFATAFDESAEKHVRLTKLVFERAMRSVEQGNDAVILFDGITVLARSANAVVTRNGKTDVDGLADAIIFIKKLLAKARNIQNGGSLTVIATVDSNATDTDKAVYEELKTTVNSEIVLSGELSASFPVIDLNRSSTREIRRLLDKAELDFGFAVKRVISQNQDAERAIYDIAEKTLSKDSFIEKTFEWIKTSSN